MSRRGTRRPARFRVTYDPEAAALYLEFRDGVAADNDRRGCVLGIEVLHASQHLRPFLAGPAARERGPGGGDREREFRRL